jgi:ABC-2 type transport system ATP-binding protein
MDAVLLEGVTKSFGRHVAVDELDLSVPEGVVYGFIGPNGSGKTTTLRMILRIFYPDRGMVRVLGVDRANAADDRIGYLPEERGLYKKMKVGEVLRFHAQLKGINPTDAEIKEWLERFDLGDRFDKPVDSLSKGMAQKAQFISAVMHKPKLVILDEPFSGLDPVNLEILKDAVVGLRKQGTTVIFSTHDMDVAERMCDTIFMIFKGRKVLDGPLDQIKSEYADDTIRLRTSASGTELECLPHVSAVKDHGQYKELKIDPNGDAQEILRAIVASHRVDQFEIGRPTLHDIFVRIAGPAAREEVEVAA